MRMRRASGAPASPPHAPRDPLTPIHFALPGHGEPGERCGKLGFFGHRAAGGETHYRGAIQRCGRFSCPVCALSAGGWASREAGAIAHRVRAGVSAVRRRAIHVVVSPPPNVPLDTLENYLDLRHAAYAAARSRGFRGGGVVFHHMRLGARRFNQGRSLGCRPGPHFHLLGDGWITQPGPCVHAQSDTMAFCRHRPDPYAGWVVKNLGVRKSVRSTALYLLSHASQGILPKPDLRPPEVVTWFGSMAYNRLKLAPEAPGPMVCAVCKLSVPHAEWFLLAWSGQGPPPEGGSGVCEPGSWSESAVGYDPEEVFTWDCHGGPYPRKHRFIRPL